MTDTTRTTASAAAILPSLDHLLIEDYQNVYEPSEDTYLMCDALNNDRQILQGLGCRTVLEIGSGSGCNITYLATLLSERERATDQASSTLQKGTEPESGTSRPRPQEVAEIETGPEPGAATKQQCAILATDINPIAVSVTLRTAAANGVNVECICTDLVQGLEDRLDGQVDVLLFNPPYVPTPDEEVGSDDIAAAWAGGERGRRVIDRFLPLLPRLLTPERGRCYLVLVEENEPAEIASIAKRMGMHAAIVLRRRARNEGLQIMRIAWGTDSGSGTGA
jgi:release factor glutamine methyltransferase